jgi:L-cysteine:1D-myo-inositol 2-amino-2-deoxy-alpha-D-glucopyranoside ligase
MTLLLYDTLRRGKRPLESSDPIKLYVCGVTPYDTTHVGHARTYLLFDVLVRYLRGRGRQIHYVQNVTDVDDSILKRAAEVGLSFEELGNRYTDTYLQDMQALNLLPADDYVFATETIPEMQEMIARLLRQGHAYRLENGDVYFRASSSPHFGELSGLSREEMLEIERTQDTTTIDDERKEDALDFALWRAARPGEPRWPSPWGDGRPGWHIECSAMARKYLGDQIDIHGGGDDLVYPHHECEIAQSEAAAGVRPFARLWVHVAMVRLGGEKMSKSLGNLVFVRDLLHEVGPDAIRLYLLGCHYRTPLDYQDDDLAAAAESATRLASAAAAGDDRGPAPADAAKWSTRFFEALEDDLDTPRAVSVLDELAQRVLDPRKRGPRAGARRALSQLSGILGLQLKHERVEACS